MFEDKTLTCFADPGDGLGSGYGRGTFQNCNAADWKKEPRYAAGHAADRGQRRSKALTPAGPPSFPFPIDRR